MIKLLHPDDPSAFGIENEAGASPILFASDHAGQVIPRRLGTLGLNEAERARHIAYDIGIYGVTSGLAREIDATYVFQPYSRLVIDCNRKPGSPQSIMPHSDETRIPGNVGISLAEAQAREREILQPYHHAIARIVAARQAAARPTVLFAMHSCTPILGGEAGPRPWQIMIMADKDWRVGNALIDVLRAETTFCIGVNEPYTVSEENDYTIPVHAEAGGLPYVEIEIRQDLISDRDGQRDWARLLSGILPRAVDRSGVLAV